MDTNAFDKAVISAVFQQAGLVGWRSANLVAAARDAGLDLARVRARFPNKAAVLLRFGVIADQAVLAEAPAHGTARDKLFDVLMARIDQVQMHRSGMLALIQALRFDPCLVLLLGAATLRSMAWLLDAAGVPRDGVAGVLRVHGLAAAWAYALRAWEKDESADLASTMAAVDRALDRAVQAEAMLPGHRAPPPEDEPPFNDATERAGEPPAVL
jgi:ubiquinone biosynthesis protein COQ9